MFDYTLTNKSLRDAAGSMIICGFEGKSLTAELHEILNEVNPLGLVLFSRNIESCEHLAELIRELKSTRDTPLLIAIDQEGGRVARIKSPFTPWPPMRNLGRIWADDTSQGHRQSREFSYAVGKAIGLELHTLGVGLNFAPVLDVDTNPDNPVIGDRSFSDNPRAVAQLTSAFARGLQSTGIAACGKHFPGHGDTYLDSHLALPVLEHDLPRLEEIEWPPFAELSRVYTETKEERPFTLACMMTAHLMVPELDEELPATLSPRILSQLRNGFGFAGRIITDDLDMKALADHYPPEEITHFGLKAGIDIFLPCRNPDTIMRVYAQIIREVEKGEISRNVIKATGQDNRSFAQTFASHFPAKDLSLLGHHLHQELAAKMTSYS